MKDHAHVFAVYITKGIENKPATDIYIYVVINIDAGWSID